MKAVVYIRVATAGQLSDGEADKQRRICEKIAEEQNLEIIKRITECGISGVQSYSRCKGLKEIEEMARDGEIGAVLASDTSRLTRNTHTMLDFQKRLKALEVQVISAQDGRFDNLLERKESKLLLSFAR